MKTIAVIGLGKFGYQIIKNLMKLNFNVIAIDNDAQKIQEISRYVENAFILDSTNKDALREAGIFELDTVVVSIGENIEASILTVMALIDLKNIHIIAKAITHTHGEILSKIGAFKIIYPEKIAAKNLVKNLVNNITVDEIDISNNLKVIKFLVTNNEIDRTLMEVEFIYKNTKVIGYKHDNVWYIEFNKSETIVSDGDTIAIIGAKECINKIYNEI